uniref:Syndecan n=1 Tax=Parascaris univalens TaxID=6257 RepID=A0A915CID1_PARUN
MLASPSMALHMKISTMVLTLLLLPAVHLFSSEFITASTQQVSLQQTGETSIASSTSKASQVSLQQTGETDIALSASKASRQMNSDTVTTTLHITEELDATRNYDDTSGFQSIATVKNVFTSTPDMTAENITSGMATSSSMKEFVGDRSDNMTAGIDISDKDNEDVTKQLFDTSSNYQKNADEENFTTVAEPENAEGTVKEMEPAEMLLLPSSSTSSSEEPSSQEEKGAEIRGTSMSIEQWKIPGGGGKKLHQVPTVQTKQKNESLRWIFFGVAGFALMAAIASATILALTYTGVILTPPRKPTPPNVLPPAVL